MEMQPKNISLIERDFFRALRDNKFYFTVKFEVNRNKTKFYINCCPHGRLNLNGFLFGKRGKPNYRCCVQFHAHAPFILKEMEIENDNIIFDDYKNRNSIKIIGELLKYKGVIKENDISEININPFKLIADFKKDLRYYLRFAVNTDENGEITKITINNERGALLNENSL